MHVGAPDGRTARRAAWLVFAALVVAGCGTKQHAYSAAEVRTAFAEAGLPLVVAAGRTEGVLSRWNGTLLVGKPGSEFVVVVFDRADSAERAYVIVRDQATSESFDRVERNVLLSSDGLSRTERRQALFALRSLQHARG